MHKEACVPAVKDDKEQQQRVRALTHYVFFVRSFLKKCPVFTGLFCKRDLIFEGGYSSRPLHRLMAPYNIRSLLQKSPTKIGLFCKRSLPTHKHGLERLPYISGLFCKTSLQKQGSCLQKRPSNSEYKLIMAFSHTRGFSKSLYRNVIYSSIFFVLCSVEFNLVYF